MRQPPNPKRSYPSSKKSQILIVIIFLAVLLLISCVLLGLVLKQSGFKFSMPALQPQSTVAPTIFVRTPDCGPPTLMVGAAAFQIQPVQTAPDGALTILPDTAGIAYWVNGTNTNYVFGLSPTQDNLSLISALPPESTATATWNNCNSTSYTLFALEPNPVSISTLLDQPTVGITIFLPSDPFTANYIIRGELTGEKISIFNTPSGADLQAEISLLETTASPDGTSVRIGVSIQNYGQSLITLSASDVSLAYENTPPIQPVGAEPALPLEIKSGASETIYFIFPYPPSKPAVLKIFSVEYELEGD